MNIYNSIKKNSNAFLDPTTDDTSVLYDLNKIRITFNYVILEFFEYFSKKFIFFFSEENSHVGGNARQLLVQDAMCES